MPKISAPTVREHHDMIMSRLIEATERILREKGPEGLSAGAVAKSAGIARNSIYRYVESVDDLKMLALESFVPRWGHAIFSQIDMDSDPADRLSAFAVAAVKETRNRSHGSLMSTLRTSTGRPGKSSERASAKGNIGEIHAMIGGFINTQFVEMGAHEPELWGSFIRALIFESFKAGETGDDIDTVSRELHKAVTALTNEARTIPYGEVPPSQKPAFTHPHTH